MHRAQLNKNCNVCVHQRTQQPVLIDVAMNTETVLHCQCLLGRHQLQSQYKNLGNIVDYANLYCKLKKKQLVKILYIFLDVLTYQTQLFGFGIYGSFRNFRNISVQTSATTVCDNVSMYSASFPDIQPSNNVSFTFENE